MVQSITKSNNGITFHFLNPTKSKIIMYTYICTFLKSLIPKLTSQNLKVTRLFHISLTIPTYKILHLIEKLKSSQGFLSFSSCIFMISSKYIYLYTYKLSKLMDMLKLPLTIFQCLKTRWKSIKRDTAASLSKQI